LADILLDEQSVPVTPSAGQGVIWVDTSGVLGMKNGDAARSYGYTTNASIAAQGAGFATDTWVTDSDLLIPTFGFQVRSVFQWKISASKTGASTAQPVYSIRIGSTRSTSDTARLALTGPAQTAVADIGTLNITAVVRSIGATGVMQGTAWWDHRGTAANTTTSGTGFANDSTGHVEGTSAGFDMTAIAGQYISLSMNGSTNAAWTLTQVIAEASW
jgi:hypothetical protein